MQTRAELHVGRIETPRAELQQGSGVKELCLGSATGESYAQLWSSLTLSTDKILLVQAPGNAPQSPIHVHVPAQGVPVWVMTFRTSGMEVEGSSYMTYS